MIPLTGGKPLKIGIGFTKTEVVVATNGQKAASFPFVSNTSKDFNMVRAVEILKENALQLEVAAVDFIRVNDPDWAVFERFTKV